MVMAKDTVKRNKHYRCIEYDHDQTGDICLIACGAERVDPGVSYGPELRECYHLHVVLSGSGTLVAGGKTFHPHFGQMFLLKHNEMVQYTADLTTPWEYCWVSYNGSEAAHLSEEIGFTKGVYCLDSSIAPQEFYALISRMHESLEMNYIYDLRRRGILFEFLSLAMEAAGIRKGRFEKHNKYTLETYVERAREFIGNNYASIRVSDVVEYIGFSRSYLTTVFHKYVGCSPQDYIIQVRMKESFRLLGTTDLPVREIAERVGYEDALNFSRAFRNHCGLSPSEYRRREQEKSE